jgi:hypothetical protein
MKKAFLLIIMITIGSFSFAQKARLNFYSAYVFNDNINSFYDSYTYFDGQLKGGYQWGLGLEFTLKPTYNVELLYHRQDTRAPLTYQSGVTTQVKYAELDVSMNYIMVGFNKIMPTGNKKVEGYGGFMLGLAIVDAKNPENGNTNSAEKFAWGLKGGANIWASDRVGIKLQAQLLSVSQGAGGGLYFGTGGAGAGISTYSSVYQFGLGGGLVFRMGR